jgi:hypothetical protein
VKYIFFRIYFLITTSFNLFLFIYLNKVIKDSNLIYISEITVFKLYIYIYIYIERERERERERETVVKERKDVYKAV